MAERLTKKITKTIQDKYSLGSYLYYDFNGAENTNRLLNKLGKLEDIMEKYGIESVEELDERIHKGAFNYIDKLIAELERDTWKKACELACEEIDCEYMYGINKENYSQYFYQQAKKEGENK